MVIPGNVEVLAQSVEVMVCGVECHARGVEGLNCSVEPSADAGALKEKNKQVVNLNECI